MKAQPRDEKFYFELLEGDELLLVSKKEGEILKLALYEDSKFYIYRHKNKHGTEIKI